MKTSESGKSILLPLLLTATTLLLSACSSDYVISTQDGHMLTTSGKPIKDKETGLLSYKDSNGNIHQLRQQDVKEIVEK